MLVTSNFSFSHSVFKRLVMQKRKNQGLFGKGLKVPYKVSRSCKLWLPRKNVTKNVGYRHFVGDFTPYQHYFSYLMATVHQSMFPGLFLTST